MLHLVGALRSLVKPRSVHIHNTFFCLHYQFTVTFLIASSILVASRQYFGEPIDCEFEEYPNGELNGYCSTQALFVRDKTANHGEGEEHAEKERVRYYTYYSGVFLTLFVQAVFFYIPHLSWKAWEGGRLKALTSNINLPVLSEESIEEGAEGLSKYFSRNLKTHNFYAYRYFACELLNLVNILGQICFLNRFIGEGYQLYGLHVMFENRADIEKRIGQLFPMRTICTFEKYGLTGHKEELEGVCLLMHNPLNEKIYIFLWFWLHFVAVMTVLVIIYRIITLCSPTVRFHLLRFHSRSKNAHAIRAVYEKLEIGDWYLLRLLRGNINWEVYEELITRLARSAEPDA